MRIRNLIIATTIVTSFWSLAGNSVQHDFNRSEASHYFIDKFKALLAKKPKDEDQQFQARACNEVRTKNLRTYNDIATHYEKEMEALCEGDKSMSSECTNLLRLVSSMVTCVTKK